MNPIPQLMIDQIPHQSGCYLFRDQNGTIIYIGKAQNLKKRINSYFSNSSDRYFRQQIHSLNTIITNNVKEALILEQNLIKKYQPRFNVLLKDSNYYPYLVITNEKNPRYKVLRKINWASQGEYFGPFPDGSKAREILQLLERLFPLAKCKGNLAKPCFYFTISQCSGHCWKKVDEDYYENIKKEVRKFFRGQTQAIKKKIRSSLHKNVASLAFEIAHKEKKILDNIDFFTSKQNIDLVKAENCDFLGIHNQAKVVVFYLLIYRYGKLTTTNEATFPVWTNQEEILETYLYQFYQNNLPPQKLYLPQKLAEVELLAEKFKFSVQIPRRGRQKEIISLAQANAHQVWQRNYWNCFQQVNKSQVLEEISEFLAIPLPNYIECLDISNLYKQDIVAGFLVFLNGEKNLAKSKLYKLKGVELESDLSRIKSAGLIHYQKYSQPEMPNLIIVDGAKEQVKAVQQALQELELAARVIGLAKDEKHRTAKIITSNLKELEFENRERIRNFLTNCQEEVHRYAINFHRKIHRQAILK